MMMPAPAMAQTKLAKKASRPGTEALMKQRISQPAKPTSNTKVHVAGKRSANSTPSLKRAMQATHATMAKPASTRKAAPLAAGAAFPNLQGLVTYMDDWTQTNAPMGVYSVASNGSLDKHFETGECTYSGVPVDGIYYMPNYVDYGFFAWVEINAYDLETGEQVGTTMNGDIVSIVIDFATDPTTGDVYGIGYNLDGDGMMLAKHKFMLEGSEAMAEVTPVADLPGSWNSLACDAQGQLYGISTQVSGEAIVSSKLCKIDKTTGDVTEIGLTGMIPAYLSSSEIDPKTGVMYWTVCPPTEEGLLCTVDLTTGAATQIAELEGNAEVQGLFIEAPLADDGAPAAVENLKAEFNEGSLSGTVSFKAPATLFDGTAASGALTYTILANGEQAATGNTTFGAEVSEDITLAKSGSYTFQVTVSNATGSSPIAKQTVYVGFGTPEAPADVTLEYENGEMKLSWKAVTESADGGYLDATAVTYTVTRFPGEVKVYEGTATSFSEPIAEPAGLTKYYYTVLAECNGVVGEEAESNSITLGSGIVPPYENTFDTADDLDGFTIIDANADSRKWMWANNSGNGMVRMTYNGSENMDDWLITPPIKLEAGKIYSVSFDAAASSYTERVEAKWGAAPTVAGMTNDLIAPTVVSGSSLRPLDSMICPEADGTYYIGIHGISDPDQFYLYVDNLIIGAPQSALVPAAATNLTIVPDPNGALKTTISFNAPDKAMTGAALTSLTKVELSRDEVVIKTWEAPAPGAALSYVDETATEGEHEYSVVAFNEEGEGVAATKAGYVGLDKPAAPENVDMTEEGNTGKVTITWDAVDTDANGNPINPALVTYILCENTGYGWAPIAGYDNLTETSVTAQAVAEGEQEYVQYAIFAETKGGIGTGTGTPMIPVGTPYDGLEETFPNGGLGEYSAWAIGYSNGGSWSLYTYDDLEMEDANGDDGYAAMKATALYGVSSLMTGKITLPTLNPGVSFYTYNLVGSDGDPDINEFQLYVKEPADAEWTALGQPIVISELGETDAWVQASASLQAYAGKTVMIRFEAKCNFFTYTFLDNIVVGSLLGNELVGAEISAPATVLGGADFTVNVTVANKGTQDASEFTVALYADGEKAAEKTVEALAAGAKTTVSFEQTMGAVATEPVEYYAVVTYTADENPENNTTETIEVAPKLSNLPKVTDLAGESGAEGVELTWSEPDLANAPKDPELTDFEDGEAWAMEYEGWTFVDVDGKPVGGIQDTDIPGIVAGETPASFFIFDGEDETVVGEYTESFKAHSGHMYIVSMYLDDYTQADDWAISPELSGDAQTISFWAKSYSSKYPEAIEMYYSTGSIDPKDFKKVGATVNPVPGEWTEYSFDVPAGAKHFAVRSCATDAFMLMLDDFTFAAASGTSAELSIKGYDVYRDGVKINAELVEECEYTDTEATDGEHTYVVVTVYTTGSSAPSNAVTIIYDGITDATAAGIAITAGKGTITVTGAEGKLLTVAAADGKLYFNGAAAATQTIAAPAGIYVVKAGQKIAKVAVK